MFGEHKGKGVRMKNIFADTASLVPRKMLQEPDKKWVVRDFEGVSVGMAQGVLAAMAKRGYVERIKKGPHSYALLTNPEQLIEDWLKNYPFEYNDIDIFYSNDREFLKKIKAYFKDGGYALTLHSGANLITSFVKTDRVFLYVDNQTWNKDQLKIKQNLELKKLVRGGNIYIIHPFYKKSVFCGLQKIKGYDVVSNLQLYLDLYNFQPRGREHAKHLKETLEEKGGRLA